ncbi:choline-phosphate cytidylyltransferase [Malassezia vespertilionis]|uniref:choline-phosphate cytidylyltransferase n=1 Tax=Malassezia vespertilionis TaxID=2020962 RepID=UPI0024B08C6A|nr:choline-phosphate cytidylyltransferase [Malassezia vespertilionis]WFD07816.1 choline-phosphate cytidylyltransferase [Malassezia vespertilionis]
MSHVTVRLMHDIAREGTCAVCAAVPTPLQWALLAVGAVANIALSGALNQATQGPRDIPMQSYLDLMGLPHKEEPRHPVAPVSSEESICEWVHNAIYNPSPERPYLINKPPTDRPVRIYADGVYDLFHYAVYLIVGVVSSELCTKHKNAPLLDSQERYAALRNCRWVDEVLEDAPWVVDSALLEKLNIDYVAHDELPYAHSTNGGDTADVYDWLKVAGKFLPTRRTEGVSTSALVARIVSMYRAGELNGKLTKMGEYDMTCDVPN